MPQAILMSPTWGDAPGYINVAPLGLKNQRVGLSLIESFFIFHFSFFIQYTLETPAPAAVPPMSFFPLGVQSQRN